MYAASTNILADEAKRLNVKLRTDIIPALNSLLKDEETTEPSVIAAMEGA